MPVPTFTPVDRTRFARAQIFTYFSQMAPTGYSLSVRMDVTAMRRALGEAGLKFYPAYLWLTTKTLMEQKEFKMAEKDGQLGFYDTLTPLYASFHEDDHTFSLLWTLFDESFPVFYAGYLATLEDYGSNHGLLGQTHRLPPENAYTVSCVPWISFDHFAVHSYGGKPYYFPSVEAGKFVELEGQTFLPLSITCHHAATDGYHVSQFLASFQRGADTFARFLGC